MTHHEDTRPLHSLTVAEMQERRDAYTRIKRFREPLAGVKRDEVLSTAIYGIAALQRILDMRDSYEAAGDTISLAVAEEVDRALKGHR